MLLATSLAASAAGASTLVVTTTADGGAGSLRQAIADANLDAGTDTIVFAIPAAGIPTIAVGPTALPPITKPVIIDGTTQSPAGFVEIEGTATTSAVGLAVAGGSTTVRGLVVNRFDKAGIVISGAGDNHIEGNRLGTDQTGTVGLAPFAYGVEVSSSPGNTIGGTTIGAANLISGNIFGVYVHGAGATGNVVEGNRIGTDVTGTTAVRNSGAGVYVFMAPGNVVGGATPGAGNVIAGNGSAGVVVTGTGAIGNVVDGNAIGIAANLVTPLPNAREGVWLQSGADHTTVGGTAGNVIAFNRGNGVTVASTVDTPNAIRANRIFSNDGLGVDAGPVGVTPNDADAPTDHVQNFPLLDGGFAGGTSVDGTLDSAPNATFAIEIFASTACDASGYGEGGELVGSAVASTDAAGHAAFTAALSRTIDLTVELLTATATSAGGNTSEFSPCLPPSLVPTTTTSTTTTSTTTTTLATTTTATTSSTTSTTDVPTTTAAASTTTSSTTTSPDGTTTTETTSTTTATTPSTTSTSAAPTTTTSTAPSATTTTTLPQTTTSTTLPEGSTTTSTTVVPTTTTIDDTTTTTDTSSTTTSTTVDAGSSTTSTSDAPSSSTTTTLPQSTTSTTTAAPTTTTSTTVADTSTTSDPSSTTTSSSTSMSAAPTTTTSTTLSGSTTTTLANPPTTSSTAAPTTTTSTTLLGSTTTTTPASSSTSSTLVPTTTTTTSSPETSTTTLPPTCDGGECQPGCVATASFDSVECRLGALGTAVDATPDLAPVREPLARQIGKAQLLLSRARDRCDDALRGPARESLRRLKLRLGTVRRRLRSAEVRDEVPHVVSEPLRGTAIRLMHDTRALSVGLRCR